MSVALKEEWKFMEKEYKVPDILKNIITVLLSLLFLLLIEGTGSSAYEYVCDYAAPPPGCDYVRGPYYNSTTLCGMELTCPTPEPTPPPTITPTTALTETETPIPMSRLQDLKFLYQ